MRILNFLLAIGFLVLAFIHVDRPHPVLWILLYGVLTILSIFSMFRYFHRKIFYIVLAILAIVFTYSLFIFPLFPDTWSGITMHLFFTAPDYMPLRVLLFSVVIVVQWLQSNKSI